MCSGRSPNTAARRQAFWLGAFVRKNMARGCWLRDVRSERTSTRPAGSGALCQRHHAGTGLLVRGRSSMKNTARGCWFRGVSHRIDATPSDLVCGVRRETHSSRPAVWGRVITNRGNDRLQFVVSGTSWLNNRPGVEQDPQRDVSLGVRCQAIVAALSWFHPVKGGSCPLRPGVITISSTFVT